jgi:hypothetical protein
LKGDLLTADDGLAKAVRSQLSLRLAT